VGRRAQRSKYDPESHVHLISDRSVASSGSQPIATGLVKNWKEKAKPVKTAAVSTDATMPVLGGLNDEDAFATEPVFEVTAKVRVSEVSKFNPSTMARDMSWKNDVGTKTILLLYRLTKATIGSYGCCI